jgi:peptidoglycan/LPS O-acetylase OafA/YrhL
MKMTIHLSGLNGIRALAALAVLFSHVTLSLDNFGLDRFIFGKYPDGSPKTTLLAGFGVSIFFSLSGFLITYLLLIEKRDAAINIRSFYIRRVLRIWPLYYLYLMLSVLALYVLGISFPWDSLFYYFFLLANVPFIFGTDIGLLSHFWSIGVEEQFYAVWPNVVKKYGSLLWVTLIACCVMVLAKGLLRWVDITYQLHWPYLALHVTRFQCMLIGAVGAILYIQKSRAISMINAVMVQVVSWLIFFLLLVNLFHIVSFLDNEIIAVVTVFIIVGQIEKRNRLINLDTPFFDFLGKISYGIYVLHPLLIFGLSTIFWKPGQINAFNYITVYVIVFLTTVAVAYGSYMGFERRFLRSKEKYAVIQSQANRV